MDEMDETDEDQELRLITGMTQLTSQTSLMLTMLATKVGDPQQEVELAAQVLKSCRNLLEGAEELVKAREGTPIIVSVD